MWVTDIDVLIERLSSGTVVGGCGCGSWYSSCTLLFVAIQKFRTGDGVSQPTLPYSDWITATVAGAMGPPLARSYHRGSPSCCTTVPAAAQAGRGSGTRLGLGRGHEGIAIGRDAINTLVQL